MALYLIACLVLRKAAKCELVLADMGISTCGSCECLNCPLHEGTSTDMGVWGQDVETPQSETICVIFYEILDFMCTLEIH